jgi:aspartate aminotransferase/aminotransferase
MPPALPRSWIADRMRTFDSSGIRRVFELAGKLQDPINLSIGQPDFDVPREIQDAAIDAIRNRRNAYSPTQGIAPLCQELQRRVDADLRHADRKVFVTSGTSGGLVVAMLTLVNPGDEVIIFDPFFVMYQPLVNLVGGTPILVDTYPDFRINLDRVAAAITPRTKLILFNSPANPTGVVATAAETQGLAELAAERGIALVSDEIYREFCYDAAFVSPARWNDQTIVIDGFSKSHAMTGWRLGFAHGPSALIDEMIKLQQYTFVCAPQPVQWAGIKALEMRLEAELSQYRAKRDFMYAGLKDNFDLVRPGGAFYMFPRAPHGSATEFVTRAIEAGLLVIPGNVFSRQDTHFRLSYAADQRTLERGVDALCRLARRG